MNDNVDQGKPLSRRELRAAQRRQAAGEDPIVTRSDSAKSVSSEASEKASIFVQPEPREVHYTPGSAPRETLFYGDVPKFVAGNEPVQADFDEPSFDPEEIGADLPKFEVPRSSFLDSLLNGTFRAESLLSDSPLTESLIKDSLGEEAFRLEPELEPEAQLPAQPEPIEPVAPVEPTEESTPFPTPASKVQEPPLQSQPIPVYQVAPPAKPVVQAEQPEATEQPNETKRSRSKKSDSDEGLFSIPSSLSGDVATSSIVIENATNPLDIISNPATGSIPIRTGTIDIQLPESRTKAQKPRTDPIRTQETVKTGGIAQVIAPLKSQVIALTGELGHARGVNFKPIDTQKYWVLGTGLLMVVVGAATLVSFLMGYLH